MAMASSNWVEEADEALNILQCSRQASDANPPMDDALLLAEPRWWVPKRDAVCFSAPPPPKKRKRPDPYNMIVRHDMGMGKPMMMCSQCAWEWVQV
jgi:hypothetical protein